LFSGGFVYLKKSYPQDDVLLINDCHKMWCLGRKTYSQGKNRMSFRRSIFAATQHCRTWGQTRRSLGEGGKPESIS
jgi:hypothetical protein